MIKNHFTASLESLDDEGGFNAGEEVMFDHTDAVGREYEYNAMMDGRAEEQCLDVIEGAETDIASLESLLQAIDEARDIGMESRSAQFAGLQLREAQRRYGINACETMMPSMECFEGRQARLATSVSMEAVKETIAKIWAWIKEQFKKFAELIRRFYHSFTKNLDLIASDAEKLKNQVRRMKFDGGTTIALGGAARKICRQGKVLTDFTSTLNTVSALTRVSGETLERVEKEATEQFERLMTGEQTGYQFRREVLIPSGFSEQDFGDEPGYNYARDGLSMRMYASQVLPGDVAIGVIVYGPKNHDKGTHPYTGADAYGGVNKFKTYRGDVETEVAALSSQDVFTLCQRISKCVASLKTSRGEVEAHLDRINRKLEELQRKHAPTEGIVGNTLSAAGRAFYKTSVVYGTQLTRTADMIAFDVCAGYMAFARKSVTAGLAANEATAGAVQAA